MDPINPYFLILIVGASIAYGCLVLYGKKKARESARQATLRDYAIAGVIIVVLIGIGTSHHFSEIDEKKQMLRDQFALSDDIEMIDFEHRPQSRNGSNAFTRGVYRFTDAQLLNYKNKTHDLAQWQPKLLTHEGKELDATYSRKARRWTGFPKPLRVADMKGIKHARELPWLFHLWSSSDHKNIKRGRLMCYVFEKADKNRRSPWGYKGKYLAYACSERAQLNRTSAKVLAILDYDEKTLSILVD